MDLVPHFRRSFDYDAWANREVLAHLAAAAAPPARAVTIFAHVLAAEDLWLRRILREASGAVWPQLTLAQCRTQLADITRRWSTFLRSLTQAKLSESIGYTNSKGEPWSSAVSDILNHVVVHAAYHRGQIALLVRDSGIEPAYTDYIHCVREGFVD